jgi:hypothetical protein
MPTKYYYEYLDDLNEDLKQRLAKMDESTARPLNKQLLDFVHDFTNAVDLPQDHDVHKFISSLSGVLHWIESGRPN